MKGKENKEWKEKYGENKEVGNIEEMIFEIFGYISKIKWKRKKTHGTNY